MPVNLIVDLAAERLGGRRARALAAAQRRGYRLVQAACADDRLAAWIDWQFAPSWWSSEAKASRVFYALDRRAEIAGFAAFDAPFFPYAWLRGYAGRRDIGIFGPFGVAAAHRKTGLGAALLDAALAALAELGYAHALIPAVGFERLVRMYQERTGARIADEYEYTPPHRTRTTILASGSGTNAQNVFERCADGRLALDIGAVIANVEGAPVISRAQAAGYAAVPVVWQRARETRATYDARVIAAVAESEPRLVLLLGWMHLLPPAFIDRFAEILNVHPAFLPFDPQADEVVMPDGSLIPAFRGAQAGRDTLAAGVAWSGASVHRVTALVDRGAILVRTPVPLAGIADRGQFHERLQPVEHAAVTAAIRRWTFEQTA